MSRLMAVVVAAAALMAVPHAQGRAEGPRAGYDFILETYVRDGLVYYRTLRQDRARLDAFVNSFANESLTTASRNDQIAFWLNAYNALVLKTVIDQYPIPLRSKD